MKPLLCKDCQYYSKTPDNIEDSVCSNQIALMALDYVNGADRYWTCEVMRDTDCGKEAKYFKLLGE